MEDLWERALQDLKGKLSSENFDTWLAPLAVERLDDATLTLARAEQVLRGLAADALSRPRARMRCAATVRPTALRVDFSVSEVNATARQLPRQ